ncbi:proprotein convertase P-domain-containing protein [Neolewinella maritima]|uniref:proprotein convertase P-domain-containing protein n=1 Tax=Neolewinella maritima TaxID=1383882 RepID=UPI001EE9751E|nr:proprotein convertase P-domain-containing protein [Neolewinella maritima]
MFCLLFLLGVLPAAQAQIGLSRATLAQIPAAQLPLQDNAALLAAAEDRKSPTQPQEFAVSLAVDLRPATDGRWTIRDDRAVWQLRVQSPGAKSLNLGFTDYRLPAGAELYLATQTARYGPFTAADNADHAEFWSPLLPGDELLLELVMPTTATDGADLVLRTVNHDYLGIAAQLSGSCNVDVVCGVADGFPLIEDFRDAIRSVAAYTLNGREQCTGFLVNNTNQDGRPLFLTAEHCRITAENAPSLVAYWNFENSTCREPGSVSSGEDGDGTRKVFNSGARLLATYPASDMTLVELDEPVNPAANAFFAGWSAEDEPPTEGVACVHHPELDEKRISLSFKPTVGSDPFGSTLSGADFNYLKVPSWDLGTTQGGSSGAPLFDLDGRARGQLLGGLAGCGNEQFDAFGYLNRSWIGGGTPATRLKDWLDPCGTGQRTIDGLDQSVIRRQLAAERSCLTRCVDQSATFTLRAGADFATGSTLRVLAPEELGLTAPATVIRGGPFTIRYPGNADVAPGSYPVQVVVTTENLSDTLTLSLTLLRGVPPAPQPLLPTARQAQVDPFAIFRWRARANSLSYDLQIATTADFSVRTADLRAISDTTYALSDALAGGTTYYWRTRARSLCGLGDWSTPATFTTAPQQCLVQTPPSLPLGIPGRDSVLVVAKVDVVDPLTISSIAVRFGVEHTFTGDLYASLVSPGGDTIRLFRPLSNGLCTGTRIQVDFADDGTTTAADFVASCPALPEDTYQSVQPLDPLNRLIGSSAQGTWQLLVTDRAPQDGGDITDFELRLCGKSSETRDLAVGITSEAIVACSNAGGTSQLQLGADFTDELSLRVTAGGQPLDNYSFSFDRATGLLDVTFSAWTLVGAGTYPLSYTVFTEDATARRAQHTLTVLPAPALAEPLSVELEPAGVTFRWSAPVAGTYTLELSEDESFAQPFYTASTTETTLLVPAEILPPTFSYRLTTTSACGTVTGKPRQVVVDKLNALRGGFGSDRSVAVYPNPTRGAITLTRRGSWAGEVLAGTLFSSTGRQLRTWTQLRSEQETLQIGDLPPGIYMLRLSGAGGAQTVRMLLTR